MEEIQKPINYDDLYMFDKSEFEENIENAAIDNDVEKLKALLERNPPIELINQTTRVAIYVGNYEATDLLIDYGGDPKLMYNPVDIALSNRATELAILCIYYGGSTESALCDAMSYQNPEALNRMLDYGLEPTVNNNAPLMNAARICHEYGIETYLNILIVERNLAIDNRIKEQLKDKGYESALRFIERKEMKDKYDKRLQSDIATRKQSRLKI